MEYKSAADSERQSTDRTLSHEDNAAVLCQMCCVFTDKHYQNDEIIVYDNAI